MAIALSLPPLIFAGIKDWKERIIPNITVCLLFFIGIIEIFLSNNLYIYISISERIFGMFIPAMVLFFIYMFNPKLSGGGDLKLLASLGFCIGIYNLAAIILLACIGGIAHSIIYKEKYIPLGTYVMFGAVVISIINIVNLIY